MRNRMKCKLHGKRPLPGKRPLFGTDCDHTLLRFFDGTSRWTMRVFLAYMHQTFGVDEWTLAKDIGRVMRERGTHEYPWVMELTDFAKKLEGHA